MMPADGLPSRTLGLLSAAAFVSMATMRVADPLLPQLAEEFRTTAADASVVATGFTLAYGLCQLIYGVLGDRFGKLRIVVLTTSLSALGTGAAAFAGDLSALGMLRFVSGCTAGAIIPLSMAHIGDVVSYERRQQALARFMAGPMLGNIAGQVFGGLCGETVGWRGAFAGLGVLYGAVALLLWASHPTPASRRPGPQDPVDAVADLVRTPQVRFVVAVVFVEGILFFGSFAYIGAFLREAAGLRFGMIGAVLACFGAGALVYVATAPWMLRRLGQGAMVLAGGGALAAGFGALAFGTAWWVDAAAVALCGLGFYMLHNTLQTLATQMAPSARGLAVSVFVTGLFLGQAVGVAAGGPIAGAVGYRPLFVGAGLGLFALAAVLRSHLASWALSAS